MFQQRFAVSVVGDATLFIMRGSGFLLSEDRTKAFCLFVCLMHFVGAATLLPCDLEAGFLFDGVQVVTFLAPD